MGASACKLCRICNESTFTAVPCNTSADTVCAACQVGRYSNFSAASVCKSCEAGRFSSSVGASACEICLICNESTFTATPCNTSTDTVCEVNTGFCVQPADLGNYTNIQHSSLYAPTFSVDAECAVGFDGVAVASVCLSDKYYFLRGCTDVDECKNPDTCLNSFYGCTNSIGSFACRCLPPTVASASFDSSFSQIQIYFNQSTNAVLGPSKDASVASATVISNCAPLFEDETLQAFGDAPLCRWEQENRVLVVKFAANVTILPSSLIRLKADVLTIGAVVNCLDQPAEYMPATGISASLPSTTSVDTVLAVVDAPKVVDKCSGIILDATASHGALPFRPLSYHWSLTAMEYHTAATVAGNSTVYANASSAERGILENEIYAQRNNPVVSLKKEILPFGEHGARYHLRLRVTDWLGASSTRNATIITKIPKEATGVDIYGGDVLDVRRSSLQVLVGVVTPSKCGNTEGVKAEYLWQVSSTSTVEGIIAAQYAQTRTLQVSAYTLEANQTYTFKLTSSTGNSAQGESAAVSISDEQTIRVGIEEPIGILL